MSDYAIGDLQGCLDPLLRLLDRIRFNEHDDQLWFVGDLVNRGTQSLEVLRFIHALPRAPHITLGNHDLHLIATLFTPPKTLPFCNDDTIQSILKADDREILGHWLRQQSILHYDAALHAVMTHAGIPPTWQLTEARERAAELEAALRGPEFRTFLTHMYSNEPNHWIENAKSMDRLRVICNYFTRMRFCNAEGHLLPAYKGKVASAPKGYYPWFAVPQRHDIPADIIFGHWSALQGECPYPHIHAIDTGYVWGGELTALRLQDKQRFAIGHA